MHFVKQRNIHTKKVNSHHMETLQNTNRIFLWQASRFSTYRSSLL